MKVRFTALSPARYLHSRKVMPKLHRLSRQDFPILWPANVQEPPETLYAVCRPDALELLRLLPASGLAVVGTRYPQMRSIQFLRKIVSDLRGSGLIVVSGLARGIDTAAHEAALEAGLPTIAVLGGGVRRLYPAGQEDLAKRMIGNGGILISEYPPDDPARGGNFLKRNRLIAAWSSATWVVEASWRSGALNTAKWAREHDRACFATPCFPGDGALAGNQILIDRDHARPLWHSWNLGEVWLPLAARRTRTSRPDPDPDLSRLLAEVERVTFQKSGADPQSLLDWAVAQNWTPQRFFAALHKALETRRLLDANGLLLKNSAF